MITNNMRSLIGSVFQSSSVLFGGLPVTDYTGMRYYLNNAFSFPASRAGTYTLDGTKAGIVFGTGDNTPTDDDYKLQNMITSGVSVTLTNTVVDCISPGKPRLKYIFTITNIGNDTLTIREVGYQQILKAATTPGRTDNVDCLCLLDRTVLNSPLVLAAGDAGILEYDLITDPFPVKTKNGIDLVSWSWGSDEQIATLIDAARSGDIDLQNDAGWRIGDMRKIHIGAFSGGCEESIVEQDIDIAISSFNDYNNCGALFQYDFAESLSNGVKMNSTNSTGTGYDSLPVATDTVPNCFNAMPSLFKTKSREFSALCNSPNGIVSLVEGFKLCMRSRGEVMGEGNDGMQLEWYNTAAKRKKRMGWNAENGSWWSRTVANGTQVYYFTGGSAGYYAASGGAFGLLLFGCI